MAEEAPKADEADVRLLSGHCVHVRLDGVGSVDDFRARVAAALNVHESLVCLVPSGASCDLQYLQLEDLRTGVTTAYLLPDPQEKRIAAACFLDSFEELERHRAADMAYQGLTSLPNTFGRLVHLETLKLDGNGLSSLPDSFGCLTSLKVLNLRLNFLTVLPSSFTSLTELQSLDLHSNALTMLPENVGQLRCLESLQLSRNQLVSIPESVGQLKGLKTARFSRNKLTSLPSSFGQLMELKELDLSRNRLTALPESIRQLSKLQRIDLWGNWLWLGPGLALAGRLRQVVRDAQETVKPDGLASAIISVLIGSDAVDALDPDLSLLGNQLVG